MRCQKDLLCILLHTSQPVSSPSSLQDRMPLLNYDISGRFRKAWGANVDWNNFSTANENDRKKRGENQTDLADAYVFSSSSSYRLSLS